MKWITREKVKVDRVACPWLIKKFIDPQAEFVFLPADTDWTSLKIGLVYDVPGCELGHHGEDVSFDSILKKYRLSLGTTVAREGDGPSAFAAFKGSWRLKLEASKAPVQILVIDHAEKIPVEN